MFPIKNPPQSYLAIPYIVKKKNQVFLRLGFNICPFKCCQSVSSMTFSLIWGRIQVEWMTVSNWLFTLIRDQFWPYELWFGLEGELKGMATSFPKFTTRFKRLKRAVSSLWCALRLSAALHSHSCFSALSQEYSGAVRSCKHSPPRPYEVKGGFLAHISQINN